MVASPLVWEAAAQQCSCPLACPLQTPAARCLSLRPLRTPGGSGLGVSLNSKPIQLNPETAYLKPPCARSHADLEMEGREGQALLSGGSQRSGGTAMPTAPCGQAYLLNPPVLTFPSSPCSIFPSALNCCFVLPSLRKSKQQKFPRLLFALLLYHLISLFMFTSGYLIRTVDTDCPRGGTSLLSLSPLPRPTLSCATTQTTLSREQQPPCFLRC